MLPSSVRRVAAAAPQSPFLSTLPRATSTSVTRTYRPAQRRRYSSSKPSRDNGSEDTPVRQSVQPAAETGGKAAETKASGEKRKRRSKDAPEKLKYPSVPTTAHIPSDFLALSSFFSLHRPISVTCGLPRNVSEDAFASIFAAQTRAQKAAEVMSTISRTVEDLEQPMTALSMQQQQQEAHGSEDADLHNHHAGLQKIDLRNIDGSDMSVTVQVNKMSGQFLPFRPPPQPQPESEATQGERHAMEEHAQYDAQTRRYKAVFTIEETADRDGEVRIVAHSPELVEETGSSDVASAVSGYAEPRSFLERMALRQLRYEDARPSAWRNFLLISVKRQRKLKMKKKKYKKLTKRLRHERLKHGRT